jgi:probable F420-dependent oxidoreductase
VWSFRFESFTPAEATDAAQEIERLGFPSLWIPEVGRTEAMALATHLLHSTWSLTVANGISRVSDRSASATAAAHRYLQSLSGGRHVLGLGLGAALSNGPAPMDVMTRYTDDLLAAWDAHPAADGTTPVWCLAAYNQRMATLAGTRTGGAHTYLINADHTATTRATLGEAPVIAAEMAVVMTDDPGVARTVGRAHLEKYINSRSHQRKFRSLGFSDEDLAGGGSDRLVDSLVVHGAEAIRDRVQSHRANGADHVGVQVLGTSSLSEDIAAWGTLASLVL